MTSVMQLATMRSWPVAPVLPWGVPTRISPTVVPTPYTAQSGRQDTTGQSHHPSNPENHPEASHQVHALQPPPSSMHCAETHQFGEFRASTDCRHVHSAAKCSDPSPGALASRLCGDSIQSVYLPHCAQGCGLPHLSPCTRAGNKSKQPDLLSTYVLPIEEGSCVSAPTLRPVSAGGSGGCGGPGGIRVALTRGWFGQYVVETGVAGVGRPAV